MTISRPEDVHGRREPEKDFPECPTDIDRMSVRFDRFELDDGRRMILDGGETVHVSPKAFRLLEILIGSHPRARSKQDLTDALWPDTFVEESNLATLIAELRSALGDDARHPRFIRTVHTFGYAFCGELQREAPPPPAILRVLGESVHLREGENVIGRDATCGVVIDDATVSRQHARITIRDGSASVEDLASKNGTFVDGVRLGPPATLRDRQTITFGEVNCVFALAGTVASTVTIRRIDPSA
jgi:DNA-binding winged helix-turn-helix (wHTH) protein